MNPSNFLDYFVKKVVAYSTDLERENYCLKLQMLKLGNKYYDDFSTVICDDCNTTILNYYGSSSDFNCYFEECYECSKGFCNYKLECVDVPDNECDCGLPHDCATRNLYWCCCGSYSYCKKCALKQIDCYDNKEYLQCTWECIEDAEGDLIPFANTQHI